MTKTLTLLDERGDEQSSSTVAGDAVVSQVVPSLFVVMQGEGFAGRAIPSSVVAAGCDAGFAAVPVFKGFVHG